jgi:hypothetical protein
MEEQNKMLRVKIRQFIECGVMLPFPIYLNSSCETLLLAYDIMRDEYEKDIKKEELEEIQEKLHNFAFGT